jgi:hypothetical protein
MQSFVIVFLLGVYSLEHEMSNKKAQHKMLEET